MDQPTARETARPPADWARAAEGIQLAGVAVFLLLNTLGVLPWSFWLDALALWPVLLISLGIRIAFEKTKAPWLLLIGPVLVLGSLAWVASGSRFAEASLGPWRPAHSPRPEGTTRVDLRADLLASRLQVESVTDLSPTTLVEGRSLPSDERARITVDTDGAAARVRLRGAQPRFVVMPGHRQRFEIRVPAELPLAYHLSGAMIRSRLDLSRGAFIGGKQEGVFQSTDLRLPAPTEPRRIKLAGVFNALTIRVPEGTPVQVQGAGLPFNAIDRGLAGEPGRPGYEVKVEGIFTAVEVLSVPASPVRHPLPEATPPAEAEGTPTGPD